MTRGETSHGRNDPPNKGETTHPKNKGETTQGETTHGRNDPDSVFWACSHNSVHSNFFDCHRQPDSFYALYNEHLI